MYKLTGAVAFLQDEGVLEEFAELLDHVDVAIVGDAARQLPELALLADEVLADLLEGGPDALEGVEVKATLVVLQVGYLALELV